MLIYTYTGHSIIDQFNTHQIQDTTIIFKYY
jgi:hypothetical protein